MFLYGQKVFHLLVGCCQFKFTLNPLGYLWVFKFMYLLSYHYFFPTCFSYYWCATSRELSRLLICEHSSALFANFGPKSFTVVVWWWHVPVACLRPPFNQAGVDTACTSERKGVMPCQLLLGLQETIISLACVVISWKQIRFSLGEINLIKLPIVFLMW